MAGGIGMVTAMDTVGQDIVLFHGISQKVMNQTYGENSAEHGKKQTASEKSGNKRNDAGEELGYRQGPVAVFRHQFLTHKGSKVATGKEERHFLFPFRKGKATKKDQRTHPWQQGSQAASNNNQEDFVPDFHRNTPVATKEAITAVITTLKSFPKMSDTGLNRATVMTAAMI